MHFKTSEEDFPCGTVGGNLPAIAGGAYSIPDPGRLLLHPWDFPGKSTGVDCHFLLQGIFPTQGMNWVSHIVGRRFLPSEPPGKPFNWDGVPQLLSLAAMTQACMLQSLCSAVGEATAMISPHTAAESSLSSLQLEKAFTRQRRHSATKNWKRKKKCQKKKTSVDTVADLCQCMAKTTTIL